MYIYHNLICCRDGTVLVPQMEGNVPMAPAWPSAKSVIDVKDKVASTEIPPEYYRKHVVSKFVFELRVTDNAKSHRPVRRLSERGMQILYSFQKGCQSKENLDFGAKVCGVNLFSSEKLHEFEIIYPKRVNYFKFMQFLTRNRIYTLTSLPP